MRATLQALQARILAQARLAPAPDAIALVIGRQSCGSVTPAVARYLAAQPCGLVLHDDMLELPENEPDPAARTQRLAVVAQTLLQGGLVSAWRNEALEIRPSPDEPALACIDRSAVRVLGITTYSVHCNGYTDDGRLIVARRAAHKRVDPGLWDNLAGGMVAAGESVATALAREAHEEAGIDVQALVVHTGARIRVRRPISDGVLAELVHVFDVQIPADVPVRNLDGEVERFETRPVAAVLAGIERGEFTVEAALATLESLERRL